MAQKDYVLYLQNLLKTSGINYLSELDFNSTQLQSNQSSNSNQINNTQEPNLVTSTKLQHNMKSQLSGQLVQRYSRQMLLKQISYQGQLKLLNSKVALIGCGGIGCPLALYLAGAGVGTLGLFDSDSVDVTNLHRQIGHSNASVGIKKTNSLKNTLLAFNPNIKITLHQFITSHSCSELDSYDLIIDGSDNPECRYIVNDFCMKVGKKLLSGACIGWEGQITCYGGKQGPCYRCIWGNDQRTSGGCSTLGVVGMLPGFVGIILGIEAIKLIISGNSSLEGSLLTYQSKTATFRKCKLRPRAKQCLGCGQNKLNINTYDYQKHAVCKPDLSNLPQVEQISWDQFLKQNISAKILDVRPANQFNICHLENMINIPYERIQQIPQQDLIKQIKTFGLLVDRQDKKAQIFVSCNRGVMSKKASHLLNQIGLKPISIKGGLTEYSKTIDSTIPLL